MGVHDSQSVVLAIIVVVFSIVRFSKIKIQSPLGKEKYLVFATIYPILVNVTAIAYYEIDEKIGFLFKLYDYTPLIFNLMLFPPFFNNEITRSDLRRLLILGAANCALYIIIISEYMNSFLILLLPGSINFATMLAAVTFIFFILRTKLSNEEDQDFATAPRVGIVLTIILYIFFNNFLNHFPPEEMLGKDENGNSIRDDVDLWISENHQDVPALSNAFRQLAFYHTMALKNIRNDGRGGVYSREIIYYDYYLRETSLSCLYYVCENYLIQKNMVNSCKEELVGNLVTLLNNTRGRRRAMLKLKFDYRHFSSTVSTSEISASDCEFDLGSDNFEYTEYHPRILVDQRKLITDFKKHLNEGDKIQAKEVFYKIKSFNNLRQEHQEILPKVFIMSDYEFLKKFDEKFMVRPNDLKKHYTLTAKEAYELSDEFLIKVMKNKKKLFESFFVQVNLPGKGYKSAGLIEFYIFAKKLDRLKALLPTYVSMIDEPGIKVYVQREDKQYIDDIEKLLKIHGITKISWQRYK